MVTSDASASPSQNIPRERKRQVFKNTAHVTAHLDVAMFARRWRRLMAQGKADSTIRRVRHGEGYTELNVEDIEKVLAMADAFREVEKVVMGRRDLKPIERYIVIRGMIKSIDS